MCCSSISLKLAMWISRSLLSAAQILRICVSRCSLSMSSAASESGSTQTARMPTRTASVCSVSTRSSTAHAADVARRAGIVHAAMEDAAAVVDGAAGMALQRVQLPLQVRDRSLPRQAQREEQRAAVLLRVRDHALHAEAHTLVVVRIDPRCGERAHERRFAAVHEEPFARQIEDCDALGRRRWQVEALRVLGVRVHKHLRVLAAFLRRILEVALDLAEHCEAVDVLLDRALCRGAPQPAHPRAVALAQVHHARAIVCSLCTDTANPRQYGATWPSEQQTHDRHTGA